MEYRGEEVEKEEVGDDLLGMVVQSEDEAYNLYKDYANRVGFNVRKSKKRKREGTKELRSKEFCCSKQGKYKDYQPSKDRYQSKFETRTECMAMVRFSIENGMWKVTTFVPTHNHELAKPYELHLLRMNREVSKAKADVVDTIVNAGIGVAEAYSLMSGEVGCEENVGFTKKDCYNYVNKQKMKMIEAGDSQSVINHFKKRTMEDFMFFHLEGVDEENRMVNFFWRDGRSRIDYDCFGDVVIFDTTYRTNKYDLICAPFVGINHHWQNVMFGCAFLSNEKATSFEWLFRTFLESMGGKAPKTIMTDQDQAMANAIKVVFPTTRHRLCLWHISKNAPSHLGSFNSNPEFRRLFYKCLEGCDTEVEFQETWDKMLTSFNELKDNRWLNGLYEIRQKWCTTLNKDVFSAGILSSQRSESTNHVLNKIASKTTSLMNFVTEFEKRVASWRSSEVAEDFRCKQGIPPRIIKNSGLLNHAAKVYSYKIFKFFEKELLDSIATTHLELSCVEDYYSFEVTREGMQSIGCVVHFNASTLDVNCSCKKFESVGLLCSHILKVLNLKNVTKIPQQYILDRWTKNAKERVFDNEHVESHLKGDIESETFFRNRMIKYAYNIVTKSQGNELARQICRDGLLKMNEEVDRQLSKLSMSLDCDVEDNEINMDNDGEFEKNVLDPVHVKPKGVSNARLKSHWEKSKKKAQKVKSNSRKLKNTTDDSSLIVKSFPNNFSTTPSIMNAPQYVSQDQQISHSHLLSQMLSTQVNTSVSFPFLQQMSLPPQIGTQSSFTNWRSNSIGPFSNIISTNVSDMAPLIQGSNSSAQENMSFQSAHNNPS